MLNSSDGSDHAAGELRLAALALAMRRSARRTSTSAAERSAECRELRLLSEKLLAGMSEILPEAMPTGEGAAGR